MGLLRLESLHKNFWQGDQQIAVLRGASMTLAAGEVVVLLGPSGCGKSTLINLIAGIEPPDQGDIWISDRPLSRWDDRQRTLFRRRHIGVIYQFFNLVPTLTVAENLQLPLALNCLDDGGQVAGMLARLGLGGLEGRFAEQLSGGEQQRVAIGRALIHRPRLILADEPTGSLDAATAAQVTELLTEQVRHGGQGLLLVTHNERLSEFADRTLVLKDGALEERR